MIVNPDLEDFQNSFYFIILQFVDDNTQQIYSQSHILR